MVCYDDSEAAGAALNLISQRARALNAKIYVLTSIKGGADIPRKEFVRAEKDLKRIVANFKTKQQIPVCICCLRIACVKNKFR